MRGHITIDGDPVVVRLAATCRIDVVDLLSGSCAEKAATLDPPEALLDGADGLAGPDFDLWLTAARHRVDTARGAWLRRNADAAIARD
ncbi:MAG TPA: hypothetical protein VFY84_18435 [Jiangellales bacterium]|nr:hypothetical protein [Jiangellales bacterium]